ncbi:MAG: DNA adenine methylase [Erysipelotrichaceae bacterium]|uniref:DNA adenine methylase n=1 Tax=Anaerorhabdus sp. TaxID=1872524 RepID=UPI002FCC082E
MDLLNIYLQDNDMSMNQFHKLSGIAETSVRNLNKKPLYKWTVAQIDALANSVNKPREVVLKELELVNKDIKKDDILLGKLNLENRRYIGSKQKLLSWINRLIDENTKGNSFFDVFAGTGVVTKNFISNYDSFILNDFLYSNNVIYNAFFGTELFDRGNLIDIKNEYQKIKKRYFDDDYFVRNYGKKFFSEKDACIIGEIRERIELNERLNKREHDILVASLIYSADKIANTVGHYDAYFKNADLVDKFHFELINPLNMQGKKVLITREDSNKLVKKVKADIAFIDPPYNSRQYSRFYHVLEGIAKWDKPELVGVAMKPPTENMSDYSKVGAPQAFDDLIVNLNVNYIVVTYNNTYSSKSSSSKNKITHEEILCSLNKVGTTKIFEKGFKYFNAGKTSFSDHKEFVFITEVRHDKWD